MPSIQNYPWLASTLRTKNTIPFPAGQACSSSLPHTEFPSPLTDVDPSHYPKENASVLSQSWLVTHQLDQPGAEKGNGGAGQDLQVFPMISTGVHRPHVLADNAQPARGCAPLAGSLLPLLRQEPRASQYVALEGLPAEHLQAALEAESASSGGGSSTSEAGAGSLSCSDSTSASTQPQWATAAGEKGAQTDQLQGHGRINPSTAQQG